MSRIAEIEAELQARWDRETLEVYADALQELGDPRGALIALAISGRPATPELARKRDQLRDAWVAGFRHDGVCWVQASSGFLTLQLESVAGVEALLASHLAPFLLRVGVYADTAELPALLDALASRTHPWCIEVSIHPRGLYHAAAPIRPEVLERFAAAVPRATKLRVHGEHTVRAPLPPRFEQLVLDARAIAGRSPMPAVTEVALPAIHVRASRQEVADLLHPRTFPGLRRLDFESNEGHLEGVLAVLEDLEAIDRLSWLRLPSLRAEDEVRRVRALLDRAPGLAIEIARSYRPLHHLTPTDEPRIRVPDPVPCAPADAMAGANDHLVVSFEWSDQKLQLSIRALAYNTQDFYAEFSPEQQAALTALWDRIPSLGTRPIGFPAAAMARVVETMMLTDLDAQIGIEPYEELQRALAQLPCAVMIARRR